MGARVSKALFVFLFMGFPLVSEAGCIGSESFQTCFDDSGNSYSVNRIGNSTYVDGYNSSTGSSWSQESHSYGTITQHSGVAADGGRWHSTQQQLGGGYQSFDGVDSQGQGFSYTCGPFGNCN